MSRESVKLSLHISPETNSLIERLCGEGHMTKSELLRKSIALIEVAIENKKEGHALVIQSKDGKVKKEIIGI